MKNGETRRGPSRATAPRSRRCRRGRRCPSRSARRSRIPPRRCWRPVGVFQRLGRRGDGIDDERVYAALFFGSIQSSALNASGPVSGTCMAILQGRSETLKLSTTAAAESPASSASRSPRRVGERGHHAQSSDDNSLHEENLDPYQRLKPDGSSGGVKMRQGGRTPALRLVERRGYPRAGLTIRRLTSRSSFRGTSPRRRR